MIYRGDSNMQIKSNVVEPLPSQLQRLIDAELALRAVNTIPVMPGQVLQVSADES